MGVEVRTIALCCQERGPAHMWVNCFEVAVDSNNTFSRCLRCTKSKLPRAIRRNIYVVVVVVAAAADVLVLVVVLAAR
jgi:hypothetical protein